MGIFNTRKQPKKPFPYYEGAVANNQKIFNGWMVLCSVIVSNISVTLIGTAIVTAFPMLKGNIHVDFLYTYLGMLVGVFLFCYWSYKKNKRLMTKAEFNKAWKYLSVGNILFALSFASIIFLPHVMCHFITDPACTHLHPFPPMRRMVFEQVFTSLLIVLLVYGALRHSMLILNKHVITKNGR